MTNMTSRAYIVSVQNYEADKRRNVEETGRHSVSDLPITTLPSPTPVARLTAAHRTPKCICWTLRDYILRHEAAAGAASDEGLLVLW